MSVQYTSWGECATLRVFSGDSLASMYFVLGMLLLFCLPRIGGAPNQHKDQATLGKVISANM